MRSVSVPLTLGFALTLALAPSCGGSEDAAGTADDAGTSSGGASGVGGGALGGGTGWPDAGDDADANADADVALDAGSGGVDAGKDGGGKDSGTGGVPNCPVAQEPPGSGKSCGSSIDLANVTFNSLETQVKGWPETATLTMGAIDTQAATVSFGYDKGTVWPNFSATVDVNANVHIIACVNGKWYGGSWDWLRNGFNDWTRKLEVPANRIGCQTQNGALSGHVMKSGDPVGFMVTGICRKAGQNNVLERSNIVVTTWP